jgi:hypothetical protein
LRSTFHLAEDDLTFSDLTTMTEEWLKANIS